MARRGDALTPPPSPPLIRVAAQQLAPRLGDLTANAELSLSAIRDAVDAGARLIVLPELVTSGYAFASRDEAAAVAIARDDELLSAWAREARRGGAVVVGGFCEASDDGVVYNSAAIVDGSGVRAVYRKLHLWDTEKLIFQPGDAPPPVVDTEVGRVGVLICYDGQFPEATRALALRGADVIALPTNWSPWDRREGERPAEILSAMVAARANGVFVICCDRVGLERGIDFAGLSAVIDSTGWVVAETEGVGTASADLDLASARRKQRSRRNDALRDRRPELFAEIAGTRA